MSEHEMAEFEEVEKKGKSSNRECLRLNNGSTSRNKKSFNPFERPPEITESDAVSKHTDKKSMRKSGAYVTIRRKNRTPLLKNGALILSRVIKNRNRVRKYCTCQRRVYVDLRKYFQVDNTGEVGQVPPQEAEEKNKKRGSGDSPERPLKGPMTVKMQPPKARPARRRIQKSRKMMNRRRRVRNTKRTLNSRRMMMNRRRRVRNMSRILKSRRIMNRSRRPRVTTRIIKSRKILVCRRTGNTTRIRKPRKIIVCRRAGNKPRKFKPRRTLARKRPMKTRRRGIHRRSPDSYPRPRRFVKGKRKVIKRARKRNVVRERNKLFSFFSLFT